MEFLSDFGAPHRCGRLLLGDFDGLHLGHRRLFGRGADNVVFSFSANTKQTMGVIGKTLYPTSINVSIFKRLGARACYLASFFDICNMSPREFVDYLTSLFSPEVVVVGENFTFGKGAVGDSALLRQLLGEKSIDCEIVESVTVGDTTVSSSVVRQAVENGYMELANELLGEPYFISGEVIHGKTLGRTLGTPTVNIPVYPNCVVPKHGVYISKLLLRDRAVLGVTNVGTRPSVDDGDHINTETFLLDFDEEIYGQHPTLLLFSYLREERKFDNLTDLAIQIQKDGEKTRDFFKKFTNC